jgi:translation initiation factor IF-3
MDDGRSMGVVPLSEAKALAREKELDLVELNGSARPPIVKILDFNKYRYQQEKQARGLSKQNNELKEVRLSFKIGVHDLEVKAKKAKEFLETGNFVRVFINLRGRENVFPDKAKQTLLDFSKLVDAELEQPVTHEGKKVQLIIKKRKNAQNQDQKVN